MCTGPDCLRSCRVGSATRIVGLKEVLFGLLLGFIPCSPAPAGRRSTMKGLDGESEVLQVARQRLSALQMLDPAQRFDELRAFVRESHEGVAILAARILIQDGAIAAADFVAERSTHWSINIQRVLLSDVLGSRFRPGFSSFLAAPRRILEHCVTSGDCNTGPTASLNRVALSAQCLAGTANGSDRALLLRALARYPDEPWLWLAVCTFKGSSAEYSDRASTIWHDEGQDLALRVAAAASISASDVSARKFATRTIRGIVDRYGGQTIAEAFPGLGARQSAAKAYYEFRANLPTVAMLRFLSGPEAKLMGFELLRARNEQIRSFGEVITVIRWPDQLRSQEWGNVAIGSRPRIAALLRTAHGYVGEPILSGVSAAELDGWNERLMSGGLSGVFGIAGALVAVP